MAKDPAFLFYYQDFLVGTEFMPNAEVGQYIRVLAHLADKGSLSAEQVLSICRASAIPKWVGEKLLQGEDGRYFNRRLLEEVEKRKRFSDSRRNNALSGKSSQSTNTAYAQHMEDENENRNENKVKSKEIPPKVDDVHAYMVELGIPLETSAFMDHYISNGWKVGKNPMRDWRAACRNWKKMYGQFSNKSIYVEKPANKKPCQYCHQEFDSQKLVGHEMTCEKAPPPADVNSPGFREAMDAIKNLGQGMAIQPQPGERKR